MSRRARERGDKHDRWQDERDGDEDEADLPEALVRCAWPGLEFDMMDTSLFLGRESMIPRPSKEMVYWRALLFPVMFRNATRPTQFLQDAGKSRCRAWLTNPYMKAGMAILRHSPLQW